MGTFQILVAWKFIYLAQILLSFFKYRKSDRSLIVSQKYFQYTNNKYEGRNFISLFTRYLQNFKKIKAIYDTF